jgi:hypothetical protein
MIGSVDYCPEAEFLEVIGAKVSRVFLLAIHSQLFQRFLPPSPPWAKVVWNWFVIKTLYTETSRLITLNMPKNLNEIVCLWIRLQRLSYLDFSGIAYISCIVPYSQWIDSNGNIYDITYISKSAGRLFFSESIGWFIEDQAFSPRMIDEYIFNRTIDPLYREKL